MEATASQRKGTTSVLKPTLSGDDINEGGLT